MTHSSTVAPKHCRASIPVNLDDWGTGEPPCFRLAQMTDRWELLVGENSSPEQLA